MPSSKDRVDPHQHSLWGLGVFPCCDRSERATVPWRGTKLGGWLQICEDIPHQLAKPGGLSDWLMDATRGSDGKVTVHCGPSTYSVPRAYVAATFGGWHGDLFG